MYIYIYTHNIIDKRIIVITVIIMYVAADKVNGDDYKICVIRFSKIVRAVCAEGRRRTKVRTRVRVSRFSRAYVVRRFTIRRRGYYAIPFRPIGKINLFCFYYIFYIFNFSLSDC